MMDWIYIYIYIFGRVGFEQRSFQLRFTWSILRLHYGAFSFFGPWIILLIGRMYEWIVFLIFLHVFPHSVNEKWKKGKERKSKFQSNHVRGCKYIDTCIFAEVWMAFIHFWYRIKSVLSLKNEFSVSKNFSANLIEIGFCIILYV